ncbi:MAG: ABC transporter ATP-binding protein [Cellulomonas sp.]|uniref:ABC transporter ATP-binding protein n=1 Tax=Cellulomonas sp. 73-92 TaxID=1895740 RepID=UPI0009278223|nr:ABC transporter ATP-binding protein [Cellulomonas sp. 73-92]MBN9374470.1 ABC transporter ATP-binding protein [Cellulomonas sp.]OJV81488.1 MAG: ABC transporter ATP-binding protein [Cellulomonas sp. 73-92]
MSIAVELHDVTKTYPAPNAVTALERATLALRTGETVAITGPSGSGKSTMLNLLGTLERPTSGEVRLAGVRASSLSDGELSGLRAWHIGFVFQQFFLLDHLSVLDNVAHGLLYRGLGARDRRSAAAAALTRVGLAQRLTHRPQELSGGERQRVAIARALVGHPTLLLADEPTGNLDSTTGADIVALLAGLGDDRTTIVVITHDAGVAAAMDRHIHLRDGRIVGDDLKAA